MKYCFGLILCFYAFLGPAQDVKFQCTDTLTGNFDRFSVDNFGKIYVVKKDVIIVFSEELDTLFTTSLKTIRPTSIESSKSFRTLLFDEERSVIQFLDNTGTAIQDEVDLVNLDIQQPILVCESFGGNTIWILDAGNLRLLKINDKLETVLITENLNTVFDGDSLPTMMKESNDLLLMLIPGKGIAKFDVFGTYMDIYPCQADAIDVRQDHLFIKSADTLQIVPLNGIMEPEFVYQIPTGVIEFAYTREKVYLMTKEGILIGHYAKN